jgi:hypothetical protein
MYVMYRYFSSSGPMMLGAAAGKTGGTPRTTEVRHDKELSVRDGWSRGWYRDLIKNQFHTSFQYCRISNQPWRNRKPVRGLPISRSPGRLFFL